MAKVRKPKRVAAVLFGGTSALISGTVATLLLSPSGFWSPARAAAPRPAATPRTATPAADQTSPHASARPTVHPPQSRASSLVQPNPTVTHLPSPAQAATKPAVVVYTVRPGDTLTAIAAWFDAHGYGPLYAANKAVIGADPNLIRPGERITVANGGMVLEPPVQAASK